MNEFVSTVKTAQVELGTGSSSPAVALNFDPCREPQRRRRSRNRGVSNGGELAAKINNPGLNLMLGRL